MLLVSSGLWESTHEVVGVAECGLNTSLSLLLESTNDLAISSLYVEHDRLTGFTGALWHAETELAAVTVDDKNFVSSFVVDVQNDVAPLEGEDDLTNVHVRSILN